MKTAAAAFSALFLAGCASSGQMEQADRAESREIPDIFNYEYEYSGQLEGTSVSGRLSFEQDANGDVRYTIHSENASAPCQGFVNSPASSRVRLMCQGLMVEFARGGEARPQPYATFRTTRPVQRRECAQWKVDERTGRRTCSGWQMVVVEQPVTLHGTIDMERVGATG
jgi:hypothetical protein